MSSAADWDLSGLEEGVELDFNLLGETSDEEDSDSGVQLQLQRNLDMVMETPATLTAAVSEEDETPGLILDLPSNSAAEVKASQVAEPADPDAPGAPTTTSDAVLATSSPVVAISNTQFAKELKKPRQGSEKRPFKVRYNREHCSKSLIKTMRAKTKNMKHCHLCSYSTTNRNRLIVALAV